MIRINFSLSGLQLICVWYLLFEDHSSLMVHVELDFKATSSVGFGGIVVGVGSVGAGGVGVCLGQSWLKFLDFFIVLGIDTAFSALVVPDDIVLNCGERAAHTALSLLVLLN